MSTGNLLLAYYGDDFTGSTDALESLTNAGVKTMLFMQPPSSEVLSKYSDIQAIGVAGLSRSMEPDAMEKELLPLFSALKELNPEYIHYKVCSTFDSSPKIGSIGRVIDIALQVFDIPFVPILVGTPNLGRYCVFGNLFARYGKDGHIYRLDRHPSISNHPVTPMKESDLIKHLAYQTDAKIELVDIIRLSENIEQIFDFIESSLHKGTKALLFDTINYEHLLKIAVVLGLYRPKSKPMFTIGSSAVGTALGEFWKKNNTVKPKTSWQQIIEKEAILVISGSCSPITSAQIKNAVSGGFIDIALDTFSLAKEENTDEIIIETSKRVIEFLQHGKSVIIHTSLGNNDTRLESARKVFEKNKKLGINVDLQSAKIFGKALGRIIKITMEQSGIKRLIIAGGDTSGYVAKELGIESLEMIAPLTPGAPLCRAVIPGSTLNGIEINFKGGQIGDVEYFEKVRSGQL